MTPPSPAALARQRSDSRPKPLTEAFKAEEMAHCKVDPIYWVNTYCNIYDNESKGWIPFTLWPAQVDAAHMFLEEQFVMSLKARQLGLTWLWALALPLWEMLFQPISETLLFSQGEVEALELLSEQRLRGMYSHLPDWMRLGIGSADSKSEFRLSNGSGARALPPTRGGDSRTVTRLVIDEADLIPNFSELLARAEPTVGRSGRIAIIGRAAKNMPNSPFKKMYKAARANESKFKSIFIPWYAHPERTQAWYDEQKRDIFNRDGSLDALAEQYPATDTEALAARSLDKRFLAEIIAKVSHEAKQLQNVAEAPAIPGLRIYKLPEPGHTYGIGADASGGKTDGDPAVACVVDAVTREQVTVLEGKYEADVFGDFVADLAEYYNKAIVLPELNNHGLLLLKTLQARHVSLRSGISRRGDTGKPGWLTTEPSKNMLYDTVAKVFQDVMKEAEQTGTGVYPVICDFKTASEISGLDINTLSAPEGEHDDHSMAYALAQMCVYRGTPSMFQVEHRGLWNKPAETVTAHLPRPKTDAAELERLRRQMVDAFGEPQVAELDKKIDELADEIAARQETDEERVQRLLHSKGRGSW
jgi:hypothetical protein